MDQDAAIRRARNAALINHELAPNADAVRLDDQTWEIRFRDSKGWVIAKVQVRENGACRFAA